MGYFKDSVDTLPRYEKNLRVSPCSIPVNTGLPDDFCDAQSLGIFFLKYLLSEL